MADINDLVLIYFEDKPLSYARIEDILPDSKPNWYHVKLLLLQIPLQLVTWILRDVYINGDDFTMNGKKMRLEKVESPLESEVDDHKKDLSDQERTPSKSNKAKVISLSDLKGK
jgi:hypothetical protein